jgi:hypothetical protein
MPEPIAAPPKAPAARLVGCSEIESFEDQHFITFSRETINQRSNPQYGIKKSDTKGWKCG